MELDFSSNINLYNALNKEINRFYRKNKITRPPRDESKHIILLEELDLIERLNLNFPGTCNTFLGDRPIFSYLTSLRSITMEYPYSPNGSELSSLSDYGKIEDIYIKNTGIEEIDLSMFSNLTSLSLVDNNRLTKIKGVERIKKLSSLEMYNNKYLDDMDVRKLILNNMSNECSMVLDILYYPDIVLAIKKDYEKYKKAFRNATWIERIHIGGKSDTIGHDTYNTGLFYSNLEDLLSEIVPDNCNDDLLIAYYIYEWIVKNINYDEAGFNSNLKQHSFKTLMTIGNDTKEINIGEGAIGSINGAFNALYYRSAVCEGITRIFQMMLSLYGIKSIDISSYLSEKLIKDAKKPSEKELNNSEVNHSIIKVILGNGEYYCDTTNESVFMKGDVITQKCFMKTFEELDVNWYPVREIIKRNVTPLGKGIRERLSKLPKANNRKIDPHERAKTIRERYHIYLEGNGNLYDEFNRNREKAIDLLLLGYINKEVLDIIISELNVELVQKLNKAYGMGG